MRSTGRLSVFALLTRCCVVVGCSLVWICAGEASGSGADRCETYEPTKDLEVVLDNLKTGWMMAFDADKHADLAELLRPSWEAFQRHDYEAMIVLQWPSLTKEERTILVGCYRSWDGVEIVAWEHVALDLWMEGGRTQLRVYTRMKLTEADGKCVEDVSWRDLLVSDGKWVFKPRSPHCWPGTIIE